MKKIIKKAAKPATKKSVIVTKKVMPISSTAGLAKVYPENKRTRVVDAGYLGKTSGVPKKLAKKNKTK